MPPQKKPSAHTGRPGYSSDALVAAIAYTQVIVPFVWSLRATVNLPNPFLSGTVSNEDPSRMNSMPLLSLQLDRYLILYAQSTVTGHIRMKQNVPLPVAIY